MIITVICDVLGEENNGTTIACMNLIRSLKAHGHQVRVVCTGKDKENLEDYYVVPELNLGFIINYFIHKNGVSIAKPDKKILENAIKDCDIVHTALVFGLSRTAIKIAKRYNKPITSSFHCQAENYTVHLMLKNFDFINRHVYRRYFKQIYSNSDCIHYPTEFIRNTFESVVGKTNGRVISNGVNDIFKYNPSAKPSELKDKIVILSVGRLSLEKKHSVLINAISKSKYKEKIHLIIAGEGPFYHMIKKIAQRRNVDIEINFFSRKDLVKIINYSDLYIHPAEVEIEAIACLEAICCGVVPIIANSKKSATKSFALCEQSLFKNDDSSDLAKKIDYWLDNTDVLNLYREKYRAASPGFNQTKCMDEMEQMMIDTVRKAL